MANRLQMLNELAAKVPVLNQRAKAQADAARQTGLQQQIQQIAQAPTGGATVQQQAGALGAQQAQAAGQQALQAQAGQQQQLAQIGQMGLQEQQQQFQGFMDRQKLKFLDELNTKENYINSLGETVKQQLFDAQMQFQQDELGRKFANERQLQDWAITSAQNEQEAQWRFQQMQQAAETRIQVMETAHQRLAAAAQRGWIEREGDLDFEHQRQLKETAAALDREIQRKKGRAANRAAIASAVGTAVGVGIVIATGGTAAPALIAGGMIGGGAGKAAAGSGAFGG